MPGKYIIPSMLAPELERKLTQEEPSDDITDQTLRSCNHRLLTHGEELVAGAKIAYAQRAAEEIATQKTTALALPSETTGTVDLSEAKSQELLQQIQLDGDDAVNTLVEHNQKLVLSIARTYLGRGLHLLDLFQEGNSGLLIATRKFDWTMMLKFSTMSSWWIRQSIGRAIADQARTIRIPVHTVEIMPRVMTLREEIVTDIETKRLTGLISQTEAKGLLVKEAVAKEIVRIINEDKAAKREAGQNAEDVKIGQVINVLQAPKVTDSLDRVKNEDGDITLKDLLSDDSQLNAQAESAEQVDLSERLNLALGELDQDERRVLRFRFGLDNGQPHTLEATGEEFGVSRHIIKKIESDALAKLRRMPNLRRELIDYVI